MPRNAWARLFVAVYGDGIQDDQHWALYIEGISLTQAHSLRRWSVNIINKRPEDSRSYQGEIYLTEVRVRDVPDIEDIASSLDLARFTGWNCQDFIIDLLNALEDAGIINPNDNEYQEQKDRLERRLHRRG